MKALNGLKVLVVEDDPDLLEILAEDFKMSGGEVELASCGKKAFEMIQHNHYDFIVSDMRMPNGDGRFLATEIKKLNGPKPNLFLYSGFNDISTEEARALDILQIYAKPFSTKDMIESILVHLTKLSESAFQPQESRK